MVYEMILSACMPASDVLPAVRALKSWLQKEVHVEACLTTVAADAKKASLFGALTGKRKEGYVNQ